MPKGGKREGSGRKKTGRTKQPYVPTKLIEKVKEFIKEQKELLKLKK